MPHFDCKKCGESVNLEAPGTKNRNHCPFCLFSLHVDNEIGDRKSDCGGLMKPIGKFLKPDGEEMIIHECINCGFVRYNRVAGDDDWDLVANLKIVERPDTNEA